MTCCISEVPLSFPLLLSHILVMISCRYKNLSVKCHFQHKSKQITLRPHGLGTSTMKASTLAMESGNLSNFQDFEQNEIPLKQRSFEDSIDTFFSLFDAGLLLIWMNNFRHGFRFRRVSCPVLYIVLVIS